MKEEVCRAFQVLFSTSRNRHPSISGLSFERLEDVEVVGLEKPFSREFVKSEVMNLFREFHDSGCFVWSLNATFLVLISKRVGAEELRDLRPISLVGGGRTSGWPRC